MIRPWHHRVCRHERTHPLGIFLLFSVLVVVLGTRDLESAEAVSSEAAEAQQTVEVLLREAYRRSPVLSAAHARWEASLEQIPQARALPDPQIGYSHFIRKMNTRQIFRIEQMFPGFGKRALRAGVAEDAADVAGVALESAAADVRLDLLTSLAEWVLTGQSARLVRENLQLVEQLEQVALQRYRAGEVSQADVLRLQMEADSLRVELRGWQEREPATRARVNAILGRQPERELPELAFMPVTLLSQLSEGAPEALKSNPDLRQRQSRIREAEQGRALARSATRPDFRVGVEFMENRNPARDEVMAMVSINLPVWRGRYDALRREAAANLRAAEREYESTFLQLQANARMAKFEQEDSGRRVRLFEESLLPRAHQTLSILQAEYQTGSSGFLDLLDAQRNVLELELALARAKTDYFTRTAQWERAAGLSPAVQIETPAKERAP